MSFGETCGALTRLITAGIMFGWWQHDWHAGMFAFLVLVSLEER